MISSTLQYFYGKKDQVIYSKPVTDNNLEGESEIYRGVETEKGLVSSPSADIITLQDVCLKSCEKFKDEQCLGTMDTNRFYNWITYGELLQNSRAIGSSILNQNLAPKYQEYQAFNLGFVGLYAKNRQEYVTLELACCLYGIVSVPLYDTLGPQGLNYILEQTKLTTIFCSGNCLDQILKDTKQMAKVTNLVCFDQFSEEKVELLKNQGISLMSYNELLESGKQNTQTLPVVKPSDVYTFSYTSGTTGNPKGAMLSHGNLVSVIAAQQNCDIKVISSDRHLSYLPMAHVFEKVIFLSFICAGAKIGFSSGDSLKLKDDIALLKPTIFASVPRIYNRFYDAIKGQVGKLTGYKKKIADYGVSAKQSNLKSGYYQSGIWDKLVFGKIKEAFGGEVRIMITAAAPISGEVIDFLKIAACCPIIEGYGQTESTGGSFSTKSADPKSGHVGGPLVNTEFKVVDVAEMGYTSKDIDQNGNLTPRGEIWIRGHGVFLGYYKDQEKTDEALDSKGWLKTGDIGQINPDGSLKLIDRKKNIFKLAQGEYVASEKIEIILQASESCEEIFIYGDSLQSALVAILLPKKKYVIQLAKELNIDGEFEELIKKDQINQAILKDLEKYGKSKKLVGFELPRKIFLISEGFTNLQLTTATQKLKRHEAKKYFLSQIEEMYSQMTN